MLGDVLKNKKIRQSPSLPSEVMDQRQIPRRSGWCGYSKPGFRSCSSPGKRGPAPSDSLSNMPTYIRAKPEIWTMSLISGY
jgi:hypothetical protein